MMEAVATAFVEGYDTIVAGSDDMLAPGKSVWNRRVHDPGLCFCVEIHGDDGAVEETGSDICAVRA